MIDPSVRGFVLAMLCFAASAGSAAAQDARSIVQASIEHWRGLSSYGELSMTIHRPDWERTMSMRAWTRGRKHSLVRVTAPKKDAGNGTLTIDDSMWSYSPKVNRVIKIPSSMMGQSWMGSDFSNKDVSRSDEIVDRYDHRLIGEEELDGEVVHVIESIPREDAAVVWGKEVLRIRADHVLVSQEYYDQDGRLVKALRTLEIGRMGGRSLALRQRMTQQDDPEEWTELLISSMEFDVELSESVFTRANLRNPRESAR